MNIFTTFKQTKYFLLDHDDSFSDSWDTWTDNQINQSGQVYSGVFKPRDGSNIYAESPEETGDATLNVKPNEAFINKSYPERMIGDTVVVYAKNNQTQRYTVIGYDTAMNYRTGQVEHYRLHLKRLEVKR